MIYHFILFLTFFSLGLNFTNQASSAPEQQRQEQAQVVLGQLELQPITISGTSGISGIMERTEQNKVFIWVDWDKERNAPKTIQEIDFSQINAVYLIQGDKEKIIKSMFKGGGGGALIAFSTLLAKDRLASSEENQKNNWRTKERWLTVSALALTGIIVGYFKEAGVENIISFPVFLRGARQTGDSSGRNLGDINNVKKIEMGSIVYVELLEPELSKESKKEQDK